MNYFLLISRCTKYWKTAGVKCGVIISRRVLHKDSYDVAIIGGGIIGTSTAQELLTRNPSLKCILLEKENELGMHQSGHNSGVIHAGMYYSPGSLRSKLCVEGLHLMYSYCQKHNIPYKKVGKLIVATENREVMDLQKLYERAKENCVPDVSLIAGNDIKEIEPYCELFDQPDKNRTRIKTIHNKITFLAKIGDELQLLPLTLVAVCILPLMQISVTLKVQGVAALYSPCTGIVDYGIVTKSFAKQFQSQGGIVMKEYEVADFELDSSVIINGIPYPVQIKGKSKPQISCRYLISCAGLFSDKLSVKTGCSKEPVIVPIRGDYMMLKPEKCYLVRGNIYPMPDPRFPFLGVHFTPRMDGSVWLGPNAVLAFRREGYQLTDFNLKDTVEALSNRGLQKFVIKNHKMVMRELKDSFFQTAMVAKLQKFIPQLTTDDVIKGPSGVRAQALNREGDLVEDFSFDFGSGEIGNRCLHVRNAPSPAATSSLAIAKMVADKFYARFQL